MEIIEIISVAGVVSAVVFAFLSFQRANKSEQEQNGNKSGELKTDIEYIKRRTDDTLFELKDVNKTLNSHSERLVRVEEIAKSAHHRIDRLQALNDDDLK